MDLDLTENIGMKRSGFTLLELMIVVAVLGILAAIALPSYASYLARGKTIDAVAALADYRIKMEQYFQDNRNYGVANTGCPVVVDTSKYFVFTCVVGGATPSVSYSATATSIAGSMGSATGAYTYAVDETNAKSTSNFKGAPVTKFCWLMRGDEC